MPVRREPVDFSGQLVLIFFIAPSNTLFGVILRFESFPLEDISFTGVDLFDERLELKVFEDSL